MPRLAARIFVELTDKAENLLLVNLYVEHGVVHLASVKVPGKRNGSPYSPAMPRAS